MYESYWKLSAKPFAGHRCDGLFFAGQAHQSALLRLGYGLLNLAGPAVVLGASGVGKSVLVRTFAAEHPRFRPFVNLTFPMLRADELLRSVASELSAVTEVASIAAGSTTGNDAEFGRIREMLRKATAAGQSTLLAFDDAHQLSDECLLEVVLPLLTMAEHDDSLKLSVILIGQPVLASHIRRHVTLSERVAVSTPIAGWTKSETATWIGRRLVETGGRSEIFSTAAIERLHQVTGGNPRRVNRLADMALVVGFADSLDQITEHEIDAIATELLSSAA